MPDFENLEITLNNLYLTLVLKMLYLWRLSSNKRNTMNKTMKIVTAVSVALSFVISVALVYYKIQIPYVSLDQIIPLKVAFMVYTFFLLMCFFKNREEYQKNNMVVISTLIPFTMAFLAFRGETLIPQIYQNLAFSSFFVVVILIEIARKKNLKEEIAQIKNLNK